jgi:hypothetical protein
MVANNTLLQDVAKHISAESTPTLAVGYCALSTAFDTPDKTTVLEKEIGRVAVTSKTRSGSTVTINSSFGSSSANCLSTTISTVTSATVFTVASTTGLQTGDRVQITLAGYANRKEERKISTIVGSTITLTEALSATPSASDAFKQMISRVQLAHGSATGTLNSGSATSIAPYKIIKTSLDTVDFIHTITIL